MDNLLIQLNENLQKLNISLNNIDQSLKNINLKINDILIYESNSKMEQDNLIYQVDNINNEIMEMKHKLDIINKFNNMQGDQWEYIGGYEKYNSQIKIKCKIVQQLKNKYAVNLVCLFF